MTRRPVPQARREIAIVCAIVLVAVAIRLPGLAGDGLWRDQANVYVQLMAPDGGEFWRRVSATEWHPPLYFLLAYGWAKIAGTSEFALLALPLVSGILTVPLIYRLSKTVASARAGYVAAGLYAVAPMTLVYAGEYLYPLAGLVATFAAWSVACACRGVGSPLSLGRVALAALLVVGTHYTGLLYVPLLAAWALASAAPLRRRIGIVAALVAGMLPFALWLPIFLTQRRIGVPYTSASTVASKLVFFVRTCAQYVPAPSGTVALAFIVLAFAATVVVVRARAVERDPLILAGIFLALLAAISAQNLLVPRYVFPYYGLGCVAFGWLFERCGSILRAADPAGWRRVGRASAGVLAAVLVLANAGDAVARSRTPKSGLRSIAYRAPDRAAALYLIAPDYLASTFAFYARDTHPTFTGFVRWKRPDVFELANYAVDWNAPDAVDRTLRAIRADERRFRVLVVVVDDGARDAGHVRYGRVFDVLRALQSRYRLVSRTVHAGRYEPVSEYRYELPGRRFAASVL